MPGGGLHDPRELKGSLFQARRTYSVRKCEGRAVRPSRTQGVFCYKHGGGTNKECEVEGCATPMKSKGLCRKHGGGTSKECEVEGCKTPAHSRGFVSSTEEVAGSHARWRAAGTSQIRGSLRQARGEILLQRGGVRSTLRKAGCALGTGDRASKPCEVEGCWQLAPGGYCQARGKILLQREG